MWDFRRYAIYYAPEAGPLAAFGAAWLGWDPATGTEVAHPDVAALPRPVAELTDTPRKYGFHGTIKPPFRLAEGQSVQTLHEAAQALCARLAPVTLEGLRLSRLGAFLALTPQGDAGALAALAGEIVEALDAFRAPPTEAEIARRNPDKLSPVQRALLEKWGYPYVFDEFRFHLTLTGKLDSGEAEAVEAALAPVVAPLLPVPFRIGSLCLFGEAEDGRFHLAHRYTLSG
jgi:putative phosphonate metabolism protein